MTEQQSFVCKHKRQNKLLKSGLPFKKIANFMGNLLQNYKQLECEIFWILLKQTSDHLCVFSICMVVPLTKVTADEPLPFLAFQRNATMEEFFYNIQKNGNHPWIAQELKMFHHMFVLMIQNIIRCHMENKERVRCAKRPFYVAA